MPNHEISADQRQTHGNRQTPGMRRRRLMNQPALPRPINIPVRPAQEAADENQAEPHAHTKEEIGHRKGALFKSVASDPLLFIGIEIGDSHQAHHDQRGQNDAGDPGIEINEQFLKSREIPGCFRRVGRHRRIGHLFERRFHEERPSGNKHHTKERRNILAHHQMRPGVELIICGNSSGLMMAPENVSLRTRQKWTIISAPATKGTNTQ